LFSGQQNRTKPRRILPFLVLYHNTEQMTYHELLSIAILVIVKVHCSTCILLISILFVCRTVAVSPPPIKRMKPEQPPHLYSGRGHGNTGHGRVKPEAAIGSAREMRQKQRGDGRNSTPHSVIVISDGEDDESPETLNM